MMTKNLKYTIVMLAVLLLALAACSQKNAINHSAVPNAVKDTSGAGDSQSEVRPQPVASVNFSSADFKSIEESVLTAERWGANVRTTRFASYQAINTAYTPRIPEYQIDIDKLDNLVDFGNFSADNLNKLRTVHFFTAPETSKFYRDDPESFTERSDDWADLYDSYKGSGLSFERTPNNSIFIRGEGLIPRACSAIRY
jgi:hypothetical protein